VRLGELKNRVGDIVHLGKTSAHFIRDVYGYITAPAFSDIESDDANRIAVLAREQGCGSPGIKITSLWSLGGCASFQRLVPARL